MLEKFIKDSKKSRVLLEEICNKIQTLKMYFDNKVINKFGDDRLARIFFLDGCAVLQFIYCVACDKYSNIKMNNGRH